MPLVDAVNTPIGVYEYIEYFRKVYFNKFGEYPSFNHCLNSCSHIIQETLWGEKVWWNNFGNITEPNKNKPYWSKRTIEYVKGKEVPMNLRYCVMEDVEEGLNYYIDFLVENYLSAWEMMETGTPKEVAEALKELHYYTAPVEQYASNMAFAYSRLNACYTKYMEEFGERTYDLDQGLSWYLIQEKRRDYALALCNKVVPSKYTSTQDTLFSYVTQGRQRFKNYSSCADLAHFLLWSMGCTEDVVVNRVDADLNMKWEVGKNIAKLVSGGKNLGIWRTLKDGMPQPGDIVLIGSYAKKQMEHVFVVEEWGEKEVKSFDYGQFDIVPCSKRVTRKFDGKALNGRDVVGYIDIEFVPLSRYAVEIK